METSFHYLSMSNHMMIQKQLMEQLKPYGLTLGQPKILDYLKDHDGANQKEIAMACHIEAGSLTSVLNRMEAQGMVERRILNGNRRSYHVFLTGNGQRLQRIVEEKFQEIEAVALAGITPKQLETLLNTLQKIQGNLLCHESNNKKQ